MRYESPKPETIIERRKAHGLTQKSAASLVHVTLQTWQNYEYGKVAMPIAAWQLFKVKTALQPD